MPASRPNVAAERLAIAVERQNELLGELAAPERERRAERREREVLAVARGLRPWSFFRQATAMPVIAAMFDTEVPPSFWAKVDERTIEVSCPCGETPVVSFGRPAECACERFFVFDGDTVRVAGSPRAVSDG